MIRLHNGIRRQLLLASALVACLIGQTSHAEAASHHAKHASAKATHHAKRTHVAHRTTHASRHYAARSHGRQAAHRVTWLQCVPYARRVSGIELKGDAYTWWRQADGRYDRGQAPEPGAVLSFKRTRGMWLGHVAVVTDTVSPRKILITQAHWPAPGQRHGDISKSVSVIDVSPDNDWTAVRVEIGHSGRYGSVYETNGFIYGRRPDETMMAEASTARDAAATALAGTGGWSQTVQFASAPSFGPTAISESAPDRSLR
ncbi:CHAP domain-containing protein [Acidisoma sp. 7E03]